MARIAHLPETIIKRAHTIVQELSEGIHKPITPALKIESENNIEMLKVEIAALKDDFEKLKNIDFDNLSPKMAFDLLWKFKEKQL